MEVGVFGEFHRGLVCGVAWTEECSVEVVYDGEGFGDGLREDGCAIVVAGGDVAVWVGESVFGHG